MADAKLTSLEPAEGAAGESYTSWEDLYRQRWQWDKVVWGTHCVDCYPGNCPYRVYVKDGIVLHEEQAAASTVDDWFHSDFLLIWHMNPAYTRIPYYHYISEARYKGAEVVTIAPDFSPSAVHADRFVPVRPGTDAALAPAMGNTSIDEELFDEQLLKEQTDLPFLVRLDNRRFLRGSDLKEGARQDQFYFFDRASGAVAEAPRGSLALGALDPALAGSSRGPRAGGGGGGGGAG